MTLHPQTKPLTYISIFSGIEAASVAWEPLGFQPLAFAEVDPFPAAVLKERYPHVPNLGDVTKIDWSDYHGKADIVVGGSPCQSFSVAGKREGLKGESGLMFEYIRCVREVRPSVFVWENVPGALSSEAGAAFGQLLSEMDELGYGLAWRVLDAQFFGVSQRRRRVFLVGCLGDPQRATEILFEPDSLCGDSPSSREKREELAAAAKRGAGSSHRSVNPGPLTPWESQQARVYHKDGIASTLMSNNTGGFKGGYVLDSTSESSDSSAYTLLVRCGGPGGGKGALVQSELSATLSTSNMQTLFQQVVSEKAEIDVPADCTTQYGEELAGTLTARHDSSPCADRGQNVVCLASGMANAEMMEDCCTTQTARQHKDPPIVFSRTSRPHFEGDAETWLNTGLANTVNTYDIGDKRCNEIVVEEDAVMCLGDDNAKASVDENLSGTLKCGGSAPIVSARDPITFHQNQLGDVHVTENMSGTITAGSSVSRQQLVGVQEKPKWIVRRLTPMECERLQGFPDNWTRIPWKGKPSEQCPDTPRYKAAGNSMAVPVMKFIGSRIAKTDSQSF